MSKLIFSNQDIDSIDTNEKLLHFLKEKEMPLDRVIYHVNYARNLKFLQEELLKLQKWILKHEKRVVVLFEGRDAAGKGGSIRRFTRFLNPRSSRSVALGKPSDVEKGQWYFRRHVKELPNPGEIVFFDRSWYNRAVVEPVMGFCTKKEYQLFLRQVNEFEHMLYEDGVTIIKLWFSITKDEQAKRLESRKSNPLKQWKISPVDIKSHSMWDEYSYYIREMFIKSHTDFAPWIIIKTNEKRKARLESIRYVLSQVDYKKKENLSNQTKLFPDPNIAHRFYRTMFDEVNKTATS